MNKELNQLLADLVVEYHKVQSLHWYVAGPTFYQAHAKMEEFYDGILPFVDDIAELILTLGGKPVSNLKEFLELTKIEEAKDEFHLDTKDVLNTCRVDFEYFVQKASEIKKLADDESNYLVSAKMDSLIEEFSKAVWMIRQFSL